jgi:segregation and condensation protein A
VLIAPVLADSEDKAAEPPATSGSGKTGGEVMEPAPEAPTSADARVTPGQAGAPSESAPPEPADASLASEADEAARESPASDDASSASEADEAARESPASDDASSASEADEASAADDAPEVHEAHRVLGPDLRTPVPIPKAYSPAEASTHALFRVELTDFAGPLDLLLFLIKKHELDIFDIPIAFITDRYAEMLDRASALSIDIAADFLVMAAELVHIKSKMLLPPKEGVSVEEDDEDPGDPRTDLVRRLLEYQKYRDAAQQLGDLDRLGRDVFARDPGEIGGDDEFDPGFKPVSLFRLVETMATVMSRLEPELQHEVEPDTITIGDRVRVILEAGERLGSPFPFIAVLADVRTRGDIVMTFIAILELARTQVLRVVQGPDTVPEGDDQAEAMPGEIQLVLTGTPVPGGLFDDITRSQGAESDDAEG